MKSKTVIIPSLFLIYLIFITISDFSFVGYWTDIIFSVVLAIYSYRLTFKPGQTNRVLKVYSKSVAIICLTLVFGFLGLNIINPFSIDKLKMRSFMFQTVEGRIFNGYFKPVGAYSGGFGNFWITETPKYFPIIEYEVYWDRTVHHDFNDDNFDGVPTNNYEVVKSYILDEVLKKEKLK
ncbi:hypothetical protein GVN20_23795 [Runella sp. CRIBMP]|uniref:hypothetical protein n=1 Tax=Runella sp. CRIBMP TaxID=2683261 RepID=UPI00141231C8|nr:hypothetical protein [Runella sp. CRIBMP]NBB22397.1 hypothetical protein [Runella sp. CRIBMP]